MLFEFFIFIMGEAHHLESLTHTKKMDSGFLLSHRTLQKTKYFYFSGKWKAEKGGKHLVSSLKMRPPPAGTCDGRASPHTQSTDYCTYLILLYMVYSILVYQYRIIQDLDPQDLDGLWGFPCFCGRVAGFRRVGDPGSNTRNPLSNPGSI